MTDEFVSIFKSHPKRGFITILLYPIFLMGMFGCFVLLIILTFMEGYWELDDDWAVLKNAIFLRFKPGSFDE